MAIADHNSSMSATVVTTVATDCAHCGLKVPAGLLDASTAEQFCCHGCRAAFELIQSNGLSAFYSMQDDGNPVRSLQFRESSKEQFLLFDDPTFLQTFGTTRPDGSAEIRFLLDGIHCAACIWLLEKLPQILPGVWSVRVSWSRNTIHLRWSAAALQLSEIATTLHGLGYTPHPVRQNQKEIIRRRENRRQLIQIGIAAAAAGNNMLIATALYLGMFSHMSSGMESLLRYASCLVGLIAFAWPGRVFVKGAWAAIKTWTPHMDLPIAVGLIVGTTAGVINTIRGSGEIYFDSLSVLILLLLVGRWIQFRQQGRAVDSIELLYQLTPRSARKVVGDKVIPTTVELVSIGDVVEIRNGELAPVDGHLISLTARFDESILTGESRPVSKQTGNTISAGTTNQDGTVRIRSTATGNDTRLGKIVELVEQAAAEKPAIVQWANRVGGYFVITVISLAAITMLTWLWLDPTVASERTVALLIVACPCALGLATPLAISIALGRAAQNRVLVKSGDVLERLNRPGMIWLDKTGTLTEGDLQVVKWFGSTEWQPWVATIESSSNHAVGRALSGAFSCAGKHKVDNISVSSNGIAADITDGQLLVGNQDFIRSNGIPVEASWQRRADTILDQGLAPIWVAAGSQVVAMAAIGDRIRDDTITSLQNLRDRGWQIGILSGDHSQLVLQVGQRLKIPLERCLGGMTPESKLAIIRRDLNQFDSVVMVGDGVNDSAALAAASVGIAVRNGAEASLAAAPVYLGRSGLEPIIELLDASRSTAKTMRRNLFVSLSYNACGALAAAIGLINPLVAAILMPISSLTVVAMSMGAAVNSFAGGKQAMREEE